MRPTPPPPITDHRVARLTAWVRLWLCWFVGVCAVWRADGWRGRRRDLDRVARGVRDLVLIHAGARFKPPPHVAHRYGRLKPTHLRIIAGSALRRALSGKDWSSRLAAILAVVRDAEAHITRLLRRLRRGLTRLRVLLPLHSSDLFEHLRSDRKAARYDTS